MRIGIQLLLATSALAQGCTFHDPAWAGAVSPNTPVPVNTNIVQAASLSFVDVSNAVAQTPLGGTTVLPAGTNWWSQELVVSGITLAGSGTNNTIIIDEGPTGSGHAGNIGVIQIEGVSNVLTRVTQIQFQGGVTNNSSSGDFYGEITSYGQNPLVRVDHCYFNKIWTKGIYTESGCLDHNTFLVGVQNCIEVGGGGFGDSSWATADSWGTSNNVFFEDNVVIGTGFQSNPPLGAPDVERGGRLVFRHNVTTNLYFQVHGTETGQRDRSSREVEVYLNQMWWGDPSSQFNNFSFLADIRGGSAVIWSNTCGGYQNTARFANYRSTDQTASFIPWYGASGTNGWDSNSVPAQVGNATTTSTSKLIDTNASWVVNAYVGDEVLNTNTGLIGCVSGNTATNMSFDASVFGGDQIKFTAGDHYLVTFVYPTIDGPGVGAGLLLTDLGTPPVQYLQQTNDPGYVWGNSVLRYNSSPLQIGDQTFTWSHATVLNRDYSTGTAKPGYTPYTYPHPLALIP